MQFIHDLKRSWYSCIIKIKELENSPFEEENKLGEDMRILRNYRNEADYDKKELGKTKLKNTKNKTDKILLQLDKLIKNPLRLMRR